VALSIALSFRSFFSADSVPFDKSDALIR
jgi:hypothetical protein